MYSEEMLTAEVRTRIEPSLKEQSAEVLASVGLDMSGAIRLFLRQVVEVHGLPFQVRKPNKETVAAMMEARAMSKSNKARSRDPKDFFNELEK